MGPYALRGVAARGSSRNAVRSGPVCCHVSVSTQTLPQPHTCTGYDGAGVLDMLRTATVADWLHAGPCCGTACCTVPLAAGETQYFEYEIKKLKPSTPYVIKVKTGDDPAVGGGEGNGGGGSEVRSDKMGTVSAEEERTRDNDMRNFVGGSTATPMGPLP